MFFSMYKLIGKCVVLFLILVSTNVYATIVEVDTSQGRFQINLYDTTTPSTVTNFLNYINEGSYTDSVFHRSVPNFIVQGGGYKFDGNTQLAPIATNAPVINEPVYSNVVGTIAMAKVSGNANSATNQWFINTVNNSANLDVQNGGFTVFGQVIGDGMTVVNAINNLSRCGEIPMVDFSADQCSNGTIPGYENFITIYSITIVDATQETDQNLTKVKNTLINQPTAPSIPEKGSSGGGSFDFLLVLMLTILFFTRPLNVINH